MNHRWVIEPKTVSYRGGGAIRVGFGYVLTLPHYWWSLIEFDWGNFCFIVPLGVLTLDITTKNIQDYTLPYGFKDLEFTIFDPHCPT